MAGDFTSDNLFWPSQFLVQAGLYVNDTEYSVVSDRTVAYGATEIKRVCDIGVAIISFLWRGLVLFYVLLPESVFRTELCDFVAHFLLILHNGFLT